MVEEKRAQKSVIVKPLLVNPAIRGAASSCVQGPCGQHRHGKGPWLELWETQRGTWCSVQQKWELGAVKFFFSFVKFSDVYLKPNIWIFM